MTSLAEVSSLGPRRSLAAADVIDAVVDWAPDDRIDAVRSGFPAAVVAQLAGRMGWSKERTIDALKATGSTDQLQIARLQNADVLRPPPSETAVLFEMVTCCIS